MNALLARLETLALDFPHGRPEGATGLVITYTIFEAADRTTYGIAAE